MTILIANPNKDIIEKFFGKVKFNESTTNTSTFNVSPKKFFEQYYKVKDAGYNPFALMAW